MTRAAPTLRRARRTALLLGVVALALYTGFIGLQLLRSYHG